MAQSKPGQNPKEGAGHQGGQGDESRRKNAGGDTGSTAERARDAASAAVQQVRDVAGRAGEMASDLGRRAGEAASALPDQARHLASTLRQQAGQGGVMGGAAAAVADTIESAGTYLQDHDLHDIGDELVNVVRRYPLPAVLVGIGVGFLIGRSMRSH